LAKKWNQYNSLVPSYPNLIADELLKI
jgi:hypothetical protein